MFYETIKPQLAAKEGVRYVDLAPEAQQRFLDCLACDLVGNAFLWQAGRVPPWLIHPEQTILEVSADAASDVAGQEPGGSVRLVGPGEQGEKIEIGFSVGARRRSNAGR